MTRNIKAETEVVFLKLQELYGGAENFFAPGVDGVRVAAVMDPDAFEKDLPEGWEDLNEDELVLEFMKLRVKATELSLQLFKEIKDAGVSAHAIKSSVAKAFPVLLISADPDTFNSPQGSEMGQVMLRSPHTFREVMNQIAAGTDEGAFELLAGERSDYVLPEGNTLEDQFQKIMDFLALGMPPI